MASDRSIFRQSNVRRTWGKYDGCSSIRKVRYSVCCDFKSKVASCSRGGRSPEALGEVVHADIEEPLGEDVWGMKCFQVFIDDASRDERESDQEFGIPLKMLPRPVWMNWYDKQSSLNSFVKIELRNSRDRRKL